MQPSSWGRAQLLLALRHMLPCLSSKFTHCPLFPCAVPPTAEVFKACLSWAIKAILVQTHTLDRVGSPDFQKSFVCVVTPAQQCCSQLDLECRFTNSERANPAT